ncbi:MAG: phage major capsid protein [Planctomycetia bacterium]|nr:phage major capsid protein [Planctomycetia bacterium]
MFVQLNRDFVGRKAGERLDLSDTDANALIATGTASPLADDPLGPLFQASLDRALAGVAGQVQSSVESALQGFAQAQTKSRKNALPAIFGPGTAGDPKRTFGRFLLAVRHGDRKALDDMGSRFVEWDVEQKAALSTQGGTTGGYLVPTEFHGELMRLVSERSVVRPRATVLPMATREMEVPTLDVTSAPSAGDTAMLGGVVARWTEEATTLNETEPTLKQIKLVNHELSGYSKVSNTLLADAQAVGLDALLMQLFSRAIAWYEDYAFLRGNGVGKPLGVLSWNGLISVTRSAANACSLADVAGMYGRLLPGAGGPNVVWAVHPTLLVKLLTMTGGDNVIFIGNDVRSAPRWQILGHDVLISEKLPALNSLGDILLMDLSHYLIGDRMQVEIAYSEHVAFLSNQSVWRFVSRVAGQPWLRDKVTLADATTTLGPFIGLSEG